MVVRYVVTFYHGTEDITNILKIANRYKDTRYVLMSTADSKSVSAIDSAIAELCMQQPDLEINNYREGYAKVIPINGKSKMDMYDRFMEGISSLFLKSPDERVEILVHIGSANPFESYMVSYLQPAFNYRVFTDNPKDLYMPEHPKEVVLNESDLDVMDFIYRRGTPVCGSDLAALDRFSTGKKQYKVLDKLLVNGLIETAEWKHGARAGMKTHYRLTFEGRYWFNRYNKNRKT